MVQSQLKRLKASLRNAGVTGQQKPKKAKNKRVLTGSRSSDARLSKDAALQSIREEFNPFDVKKTKSKHEISGQGKIRGKEGRPALSKSAGEELVALPFDCCVPSILIKFAAQKNTAGGDAETQQDRRHRGPAVR